MMGSLHEMKDACGKEGEVGSGYCDGVRREGEVGSGCCDGVQYVGPASVDCYREKEAPAWKRLRLMAPNQQAKIQELSQDVPKGCLPRSLSIHIRGELTRKVGPGDVVEISGYTGFRAMKVGLLADTLLEAMSITHSKKRYEEIHNFLVSFSNS
ncbi:DNA replication licensing factor [Nymphaea thermarum]|nr:DNA replication licensing factor [Nymphaea thermarum]